MNFADIRAVLFDVDGTLYDQAPLRRRMLGELARLPWSRPDGGIRVARRAFRGIRAFRRVLEELRLHPPGRGLRRLRYVLAAERAGLPEAELRKIVNDWMTERPLPALAGCARPQMRECLAWLRASGRRLGVLSDYPAEAKLERLGVAKDVSLRLCCDDADIDAFKPHPHGYLRACAIWGLAPTQVLYVGDREEVDGAGARAAGMPYRILGAARPRPGVPHVAGFEALRSLFAGDAPGAPRS